MRLYNLFDRWFALYGSVAIKNGLTNSNEKLLWLERYVEK